MNPMGDTERMADNKKNAYAEAADPTRYRIPDAPVSSCAAHGSSAVLCTTAGKNGRNGRTAAVGATVFWLTCPNLNALVARMERNGGVQIVAEQLRSHASLRQWHVASHDAYEARVKSVLSDVQWQFFRQHFLQQGSPKASVSPPSAALPTLGASHSLNTRRKYGNAAVSHAEDMKCLHALVGQSLGGAPNPIGSLVLNYIHYLHSCIPVSFPRNSSDEAGVLVDDVAWPPRRRAMDDAARLTAFITAFVEAAEMAGGSWDSMGRQQLRIRYPTGAPDDPCSSHCYEWCDGTALLNCSPDLCQESAEVLLFLEGHPLRRSKKHRIN